MRPLSVYRKYGYYLQKYSTSQKIKNLVLNFYEAKQKRIELNSYPSQYTIDPGNFCNLRCPGCHTGIKHPEMIQPSFLTLGNYQIIFNQIKEYAFSVALYNWGEPFLNKALFDMIAFTTGEGVATTIHSNFNLFNEKMAENCVKSGLTHIYLSIDGYTNESYQKYRVKGDIDKVLKNVEILLDTKKRMKSNFPIVTWKYLVFEHNKHEVEQAREKAKILGVDEFEVFAGSPKLCDIYEFANEYRNEPHLLSTVPGICSSLWRSMYINSDGSLFPCSLSFREKESFGNMIQSAMKELWKNEKYRNARSMFSKEPYKNEIPLPCRGCKHYFKERGWLNSYVHESISDVQQPSAINTHFF